MGRNAALTTILFWALTSGVAVAQVQPETDGASTSAPAAPAVRPTGAPDELIGTYLVSGRRAAPQAPSVTQAPPAAAARFEGKLLVKPVGEGRLKVTGDLGPFGSIDLEVPRGTRTLVLEAAKPGDELGVAQALVRHVVDEDDLAADGETGEGGTELQLEAHPEGAGYRGTLVRAGQAVAKLKIRRVDRAIAFHDTYEDGFGVYARQVVRFYKAKGWAVREGAIETWDEVLDALREAEFEGFPYTRVVIVSHAGWDGPLLADPVQISPWGEATDRWDEVLDAFRRGTAPNARMYFSGCHTGGSNRYEGNDDRRWAVELGRATERFAAGPAGSTSTVWTLDQVKAVLEQDGKVRQEVWGASRDGVVQIGPKSALAAGKTTPWADYAAAPDTSEWLEELNASPASVPSAIVDLPLGAFGGE